jgi:proline racemase
VHAEGEPGRVVVDAGSLVLGDTMAERLAYCREHLQELRTLLLHEPRGYPALCAVLILPPVTAGADFGIVVLEQGGFTPMSGSNTMCAVAGAVAGGLLRPEGRTLDVTIDTAVGLVSARAEVRDGHVVTVTVTNVPAYVVALDRAHELVRMGALLRIAAREQVDVRHPLSPGIAGVSLVMLHSGPRRPGEQARNTVVLTQDPLLRDRPETWTGFLDRSPCGTGTCGRMAALHARGDLAVGEDFVHHSILGTRFVGCLSGTTTVAGVPAVLPTITGRTWVTGHGGGSWSPGTLTPPATRCPTSGPPRSEGFWFGRARQSTGVRRSTGRTRSVYPDQLDDEQVSVHYYANH